MKILIVGNGGREHALLWKIKRDAPDSVCYITRGNGGTDALAIHLPFGPDELPALTPWAEQEGIDLAVIGPEAPLAAGLTDALEARRVPVFGPSRAAARIESSKRYAKEIMRRAGVPTARFRSFTDAESAAAYIADQGAPIVVKASGLAAGKGAIVCLTQDEATEAAHGMLEAHQFGEAGDEVVVEEFMEGEELSVFCLTDGAAAVLLLPSQDHKRIGEGDRGPNTGGMGAYAPVSIVDDALLATVHDTIVQPTLDALHDDGATFRGLLYAGLMLTDEGPKVVEFNARFGDPETQVVLPMLQSSLLDLLLAVARHDGLAGAHPEWRPGAGLTTVLASGGYPGTYEKGKPIDIPLDLLEDDDIQIFHAGTRRTGGKLLTSGGRVLAVTAEGGTLQQAADRSRHAADRITFEGRQFRSDIGWRELERHAGAA
ncbi:MAG TPA: phosphoribosylamine--glycine ligase [Longimicrobiales bacterium]|nr:phosphoribosylamine--glycine ligase [Longimicrobiales bacterium]